MKIKNFKIALFFILCLTFFYKICIFVILLIPTFPNIFDALYVQSLQKINPLKYPTKMQSIIEGILSQKIKQIPKPPRNPTERDIKLLQEAIQSNANKKNQILTLKILLAEGYKKIGSDKCQRQIAQIGVQGIKGFPYENEARFRMCMLIADSFDDIKIDMVNFHYYELLKSPEASYPQNKYKLQLIKAGIEGLKKNYYKAAVAFYKTSKDVTLENNEQMRIEIIQKAIILCFLSEKSKELHQLICQLYINEAAKKSPLYHLLLTKLYSETIIDVKQAESLRKILPSKFSQKDSDNITMLSKCIFIHNMISIRKCFQSISIAMLSQFIGINEDDLLKMIENSYTLNELEIDQVTGYVHIKPDPLRDQILIKNMFDNMESLIAACESKK